MAYFNGCSMEVLEVVSCYLEHYLLELNFFVLLQTLKGIIDLNLSLDRFNVNQVFAKLIQIQHFCSKMINLLKGLSLIHALIVYISKILKLVY